MGRDLAVRMAGTRAATAIWFDCIHHHRQKIKGEESEAGALFGLYSTIGQTSLSTENAHPKRVERLLAGVDDARAACPVRSFGGYRNLDCAQAIFSGDARGAVAQDGVDEVDHLG
jgi:hypothetical protein